MKQNEKLSIREFYSPWYGIVSCLLLGLYFIFLACPMLRLTTQAGTTFAPNGYAFIFGFSVNFPELLTGIVVVTKFNIKMAIPLILVALAFVLYLCSKFSLWFGFAGSASLIVAGILTSLVTNFDFYGYAARADFVNILVHSTVHREPGYYMTFITLFVIAAVSVILMMVMRIKARSRYNKAKIEQESVGLADYYINKK